MAKKIWEFRLEDGRHSVELKQRFASDKREILVDGMQIESFTKSSDTGSHEFAVSGHTCVLKTEPGYELYVDGKRVLDLFAGAAEVTRRQEEAERQRRREAARKRFALSKRSPLRVALLILITFGIYGLYWYVITKEEMVGEGAEIPTAWLIIVPLVNYYWMWKFCKGVEVVTDKEMSALVAFLLLNFLSIIGAAIIQSKLNKFVT